MSVGYTFQPATESTLAATYAMRGDYDINGNLIYLGRASIASATSSALWQLRKLTYDVNGNLVSITWADGDQNYNNVWDNRASYSYS